MQQQSHIKSISIKNCKNCSLVPNNNYDTTTLNFGKFNVLCDNQAVSQEEQLHHSATIQAKTAIMYLGYCLLSASSNSKTKLLKTNLQKTIANNLFDVFKTNKLANLIYSVTQNNQCEITPQIVLKTTASKY